jgi:hypothetical protein
MEENNILSEIFEQENQHNTFINDSKQSINWFIMNSNYKNAFIVFINLLHKTNSDEHNEIIEFYYKLLYDKIK